MVFQRSALVVVFWRAVRLSLPLTLSACGPSRVTPVSPEQRDCSSSANCSAGIATVEVNTQLAPGTVPERFECDEACRPVMCPSQRKACVVDPIRGSGPRTVTCEALTNEPLCPVPGRPVPEWARSAEPCSTAQQFFTQMARAEAESVAEFERLATELELHGAPPALSSRARAAAEEERRHAAVTARLAQSVAPAIPAPPQRLRSLEQLAEANLLEGCINETMSAVLVATQAEHAPSARTRQELATIARDELSHAELSWELHAWLVSRLDATARRALANAGRARVAQTLRRAVQRLPEEARLEAGLPDERVASAKARVLADELWLPALAALC